MRHLAIWRLATILLLATVPLAASALAGTAPAVLADHGNHGDSDDGNRGHGNDPDGHDEDNPGNSSGPGNTGKRDDKDTTTGKQVETVPVAGYVVAVDCHLAEDGATTTCDIAATAPEGGKKVTFLQVPTETLCAGVVETTAKLADPDPKTHVAGYASHGSDAALSLTLDGPVTTAGTATYWIKAGGDVFPVEGPGLRCDLAAAPAGAEATVTFSVDATATPSPTTGTITVEVLSCAGVPTDPTDFDWFGACPPGADPPRDFTLAPSDDSAAPVTASTDAAGEATFADLAPGKYRLDLVDGSWCHAVSDSVTADSEVAVEAGATSTVWIFVCDSADGV